MTDKYILKDKEVVEEPDLLKWGKWMETADRTVAKTKVGDKEVSTVFLGLDHSFDGKLELFETMIFSKNKGGEYWRYSTWKEAEKGHKKVVKEL